MTADRIEIELADARFPDLINLVTALDDFLNKVCGVERNHGSPIDRLAHDDTQMFIARIAGQAVGCAGLQVFADGTGEVKRMYVVTEVRTSCRFCGWKPRNFFPMPRGSIGRRGSFRAQRMALTFPTRSICTSRDG